MPSVVVVGTQWGDEGKGKITDYLSSQADIIARYQGGDNAGHTIQFNQQTFKLHLVPSGIFSEDKLSVIGNGVVVNPKSLLEELAYLRQAGISCENLRISERAQVILPYHQLIDRLDEERKGDNKIGTTQKGIGPAYMDKIARNGIRMADLIDPETFAERLSVQIQVKNELLTKVYDQEPLDYDTIYQEYLAYGQELKKYVTDTSLLMNDVYDQGKNILFEGAQGVLLDIDHGTYPFVTSSNPIAGGATVGCGIGPSKINTVIGVMKAYTSRAGDGPFPTELHDAIGDRIREVGHEYGTTTGRPRRVGWFDGVVTAHARRVSGLTKLSLNCLDVLTGLDEIKVCVGYQTPNGQVSKSYPANLRYLAQCQPIYESLPGWEEDITGCQDFDQLPENAKTYVRRISEIVGAPIATVSVGPDRTQTLILDNIW
ncbi:adenylosuccinate synthase [Aerococcus urinae]|uniref:adenylosuccinate synthase n=1 Tax=Aerococcus urinae TaxID=1376 RepID=UPI0018E1B6D5|nr:adenylosuccinate synthase [Aerococcus urinae]